MPASFSPDQSKLVFKIPSQDLLVENIGRKQAFVTAKFVSARDTIQSEAFYFERAKDLDLPAFQMSHEVLEEEDGWYMWLTSTHLMRQVYIRYDGETEVRMDENYFDLQPKQKKKIRIHKRDQDSIKPLEFRIFTLNQIKA